MAPDVLVLGCGFTGRAVAHLALARGLRVVGTVRSDASAERLRSEGIATSPVEAGPHTHVIVCFPPDRDAELAPSFAHAGAVTYVSTTGVYGDGAVDDTTPVDRAGRNAPRLAAEDAWRAIGATVLRCPGIYGADRGIHVRMKRGEHRIPGDGSRHTSRIHVEDLATLLLATRDVRGETFVVGDLSPAPQREVCAWIAEHHGVPFPPLVPMEEVHETLRSDRRVDPSRALARLGVTLRYPTYRDGMG